MKILVLMPMDERLTANAAALYSHMPEKIKDITFSIPMFMEYLIDTKMVENWMFAMFYAMSSANALCRAADKNKEDLIIFGNAPKDLEFDAVFSFQDAEEALPYNDLFLEKVKEIVAEEDNLSDRLNNLYTADDVIFKLHNCAATADFLSKYIKTNPNLDEIKEKYKEFFRGE